MYKKTKVGIYEVSTCVVPYFGSPGIMWETMVFNDETGDTDVRPEFTRRYKNQNDAMEWHDHVVAEMQQVVT